MAAEDDRLGSTQQAAWDGYRARGITPGPEVESDADLEAFLRAKVGTLVPPERQLPDGRRCRRRRGREGSVRSVGRMRIVDASIMPRVVTANLNAAVMMMAEKVSDRTLGRPALPPSDAPYFRSTD